MYDHFGMELTPAAAENIRERVAARPTGGYGANRYRFEDFGLDPEEQRARFAGYMDHFGVAEEFQPG